MSELLEYKGYYAVVEFSAEDRGFHGKLIGINDLVNFEGETVQELITAFHEAVEDYLETCKRLKKVPEKTYKGSFNVRIPPELHREAARAAAHKNMSLNDFVRYAIDMIVHKSRGRRSTQLVWLTVMLLPALMAGFVLGEIETLI